MSKKIKIMITYFLILVAMIIFGSKAQAASASISASTTSAKVGENIKITVSINGASWNLNLSGAVSNSYADVTDDAENTNKTYTTSFTPSSAGKYTVNLKGKVNDSNFSASNIDTAVTINVSNTTTGTTTKNETTPSTNQKAETQKKSSNANLSNLGIRPNDFSGFKAGTTTYNVTVPKNVEEVEVYGKAQDSKSKVAGTGKKKLQEGKNTATVTVTAEDGTKKTYTINITRSATEEENNEEDVDDPEADDNNETDTTEAKGLSELKIGNLELSPTFRTDIYEYTAKYIGEDTKLEVSTITTEDDYTIEVTGNEDLKEGENIITILVSDAEGNNVATYQVTVNKSLAQETLPENQDENGMKILGIVVGAVIVLIIIFLIVRHRRNKKWEEEYSTPFSTLNDDDNIYKNQLEDFDENMKPTKRKEIRDSHQDKKAAKEEYLNNFNSNNDEYSEWQEETVKKRRTKGKRFK